MAELITYVGLDVHKETIAVVSTEAGGRGEVREHGKIANNPTALLDQLGEKAFDRFDGSDAICSGK